MIWRLNLKHLDLMNLVWVYKMYSEEEAIQLLIKFNQEIREVEDVRGWFERFKKK